jgi:heme/copper-type cytochrome/quinol oxidase subunit 4
LSERDEETVLMLFHSFAFFAFFCVVFGGYWTLRAHEYRMAWLVGASIVFYAAWNPWCSRR